MERCYRFVLIAAAIAILTTGLGPSAARADGPIKAGEWDFTVQVPEEANLAPRQLAPGVQRGPGGQISFTRCISLDSPFPPIATGPSHDEKHACKVDETDVSGGTVRWSTTCSRAQATVHVESTTHYHGETSDGELTIRTTLADRSLTENTMTTMGRYLGPCNNK